MKFEIYTKGNTHTPGKYISCAQHIGKPACPPKHIHIFSLAYKEGCSGFLELLEMALTVPNL